MADFKVKRRNAAGSWVTEFDTAALNAAQLVQDGRLDTAEGEIDTLQTDLGALTTTVGLIPTETNLSYDPATRLLSSDTGTDATLPLVDGTNPGLMSVTERNKLAGIETAATADQTGAEILARLLDVDGSGSGLDADTLHGFAPQGLSVPPSGEQIIRSNASGYIYAGWINTVSGATTATIDRIYASNDAFLRYVTPATFRSQISADVTHCDIERELDATYTGSGTTTVTLGTTVGGVAVAGATAAFGTITSVGTASTTSGGYATVFRYALASAPAGSQVNWPAGNGVVNNGFFLVPIDSSRRFKLYRHSSIRILIDVQGLIFG